MLNLRTGDYFGNAQDSTPDPDEGRLFAAMDNSSTSLMFADRSLKLGHVNPGAFSILKSLEQFLPSRAEYLVGRPISLFHRQPVTIGKILGDPRNLPYQTQIIIGPKILDLQAQAVYNDNRERYLGIVVQWTDISSSP